MTDALAKVSPHRILFTDLRWAGLDLAFSAGTMEHRQGLKTSFVV